HRGIEAAEFGDGFHEVQLLLVGENEDTLDRQPLVGAVIFLIVGSRIDTRVFIFSYRTKGGGNRPFIFPIFVGISSPLCASQGSDEEALIRRKILSDLILHD